MKILTRTKTWITLAVIGALALSSTAVLAHEHRESGGYQFVVGFMNEPAHEGFENAVSIRVTKSATADAHSHDEEAAHSPEAGTEHNSSETSMIDVEEHGGLFVSPALAHDATYNLDIRQEWEGLTIPYHSHLDHEITGSITVSDSAQVSGTVNVAIGNGTFNPADITVKPGSTIVWTNQTDDPHIVTSGVMSATDDSDEMAADHSHEEVAMAPVEGLESTLQVEVTHIPTGVSKTLPLRSVFGEPGHYAADLIPTAPGQYRFRFFGTVEGMNIDETFESGPDTFDNVEEAKALQFPEPVPAVREIEGAVRGTQATAQEAQDAASSASSTASSASTLAIIGIVLGVVGIVSGIGGLAVGLRKR
jgi:plastocyanin